MRSAVACASALAVVPLAASSGLADGVALLQFKVDQPGEDTGFQLLCDEMLGCRYHSLEASTTPKPYQLICDDKEGCRYTGIEKPAPKNPTPLLKVQDQDKLQLVINSMQKLMMPPKAPVNPFAGWNMTLVKENLHKAFPNPPNLEEVINGLPENFPKPTAEQMAQWTNEYRGVSQPTTKVLKPNASNVMYLLDMLPKPWEVSAEAIKESQRGQQQVQLSQQGLAHFIPDNKMCCVQGAKEYIAEKLAKLKVSPIGAGYQTTTVEDGPCADAGYDQGPNKESCFPKSNLWMSASHPIDITSEPKLMAAYAAKHGFASIAKGMAELCKP